MTKKNCLFCGFEIHEAHPREFKHDEELGYMHEDCYLELKLKK